MTEQLERRTVQVAQQRRLAPIQSVKKDARTVSVMWSSGARRAKFDWAEGEVVLEELDMSPEAVDMTRLKSGAPVLNNHNRTSLEAVLGVVENASLDAGRGFAELRFSERDSVEPYWKDIRDGIIRGVSVGYSIQEMREVGRDQATGLRIMRATRWQPFEISMVAVGAEAGAAVRTDDESRNDCDIHEQRAATPGVLAPGDKQPAVPANQRRNDMSGKTDVELAAEQEAAEKAQRAKVGAVEAEKERREAIVNLCKSNKIDARVEARWIEDGVPLTKVAKEVLDVMEERGRARPAEASTLGLSRAETQNYSLFRAIRAMKYGAQEPRFMQEAGFELLCSREVGKKLGRELTTSLLIPGEVLQRPLGEAAVVRAMATTPGSKGGYMVNVTNMGFIDILRNRSVAMAMGARQLSGLVGNVAFPRQTGKVSVTWQGGEGVSVTAADQALGQLSMTPKTCIAITDVSEQLLRQATPSAEAFVMADLAADVAIDGVDAAVINGTGGAQPLGIKNTTGITSGQDSASATYAKVLAFVSTAGGLNAIRGNPGFVTNTAGAAKLMQVQRFTSTDTPVWEGNMLDGTLVGFNAMSSEQLASGNLIFGSWDEVVIGDWGVLELSMDNGGTRFNQAQVGIRALWMVDVLVRYPTAFVVSTNLS